MAGLTHDNPDRTRAMWRHDLFGLIDAAAAS